MAAQAPDGDSKQSDKRPWLGPKPLRTVLRIGAAVGSVWIVGAALTAIWPVADRVAPALPSSDEPDSLAPYPNQPVTVMVVGVDANGIGDPINRAAPSGPANADSVMLIRVEALKPLQILQMPTELGVNLPGIKTMQPLASSYRQGGVALTADVVADVVGLPEGEPSRFVVMPRKALRHLVNGLGDVDVRLDQTLTHQDKRQNYSVNLQAGRQSLNGAQAEQLVRFRPDPLNNHERRLRQQWLMAAIHDQLQQPNAILVLPGLVNELSTQVETDLNQQEWLSLAAAALSSDQPPVVSTLPLAPRAGEQPLRQLKADASAPLWPKQN
ncbi:LCP family protein [Synechococcus sp. RS9916]|uniref:LCP family protein n=1 Tax=Synechococcus sp. RS9916 TaxID=221359 RepID=UPI00030FBB9A|nr:LCP family protein [Synechococcus sp. RS9916]